MIERDQGRGGRQLSRNRHARSTNQVCSKPTVGAEVLSSALPSETGKANVLDNPNEEEQVPHGGKSEQLYHDLINRTQSARRQNNLTNVWNALQHLREMKSRDFSVASVARAIAALGLSGPKAQSIRNAEGEEFRALIAQYKSEFGPPDAMRESSLADDLVSSIPDLRAAAMVQTVLAENKSLRRRLDLLKNEFLRLAPVDLSGIAKTPNERVEPRALPSSFVFSSLEVAAASSFLESIEKNREDLEWEFDVHSGALLWRGGVLELAGPGFYHLLMRITKPGA